MTAADIDAVVAALRTAGCVFAEEEAGLLISVAATGQELAAAVARRVAGEPLEVILGWAEFCGLRILLDPGVFVPRRRTELLVAEAVRVGTSGSVVVDLCCGSGAVGVAVATALPGVALVAADIEPAAVRCAQRNVGAVGGRVFAGDLYAALPDEICGRVTVLVVNAPYVPTGAIGSMPREARLWEPVAALDGGVDGLDVQRRVIADAATWLAPGGHLLIETSQAQAPVTAACVETGGLRARVVSSDDLDGTVVIGKRTGRLLSARRRRGAQSQVTRRT